MKCPVIQRLRFLGATLPLCLKFVAATKLLKPALIAAVFHVKDMVVEPLASRGLGILKGEEDIKQSQQPS